MPGHPSPHDFFSRAAALWRLDPDGDPPDRGPRKPLITRARLATLAYAALGAGVFHLLGLPLPLFLGPLAGCLVAALAGAKMQGVGAVGLSMRTVLGVAAGSAVTPELLSRMGDMAVTVALIPIYILCIGLVGYPIFRRVYGYDHATAYYCAMPGGLQDMLIFGQDAGGKVRTLSLVHATRVLLVVTLAPLLVTWIWGADLSGAPGLPAADVPALELGLMLLAALGGYWIAKRLGLFGAAIFGPMIAAAALSLSGVLGNRPPAEVIMVAQFVIGLSVGARYMGVTLAELRKDVTAGAVYCAALGALAVVFAEGVALAGLAPPMEAFLAFAPGGQGEMILIALLVGADLPFVVTHHLTRLVVVITGAPLAARLFQPKEKTP